MNPTNHWKLGLFVLASIVMAFIAAFYLGARRLARDKIIATSYFDESVQGLDVGSPVKMRGVQIGSIRSISFARDQRLVKVESFIYQDTLMRVGLGSDEGVDQDDIPNDLMVRLASQGITGVRFLEVDFLDPVSHPRIQLPFKEPMNYLPSTTSTLKGLEDTLNNLALKLPLMMDRAVALMDTINEQVGAIDAQGISTNLVETLELLEARLAAFDTPAITADARAALADLRGLLQKLGVDGGPLDRTLSSIGSLADATETAVTDADLPATTAALREAVDALVPEAGRSLSDAQAALEATRRAMSALGELLDYIERDPGALIRGRVRETTPRIGAKD